MFESCRPDPIKTLAHSPRVDQRFFVGGSAQATLTRLFIRMPGQRLKFTHREVAVMLRPHHRAYVPQVFAHSHQADAGVQAP